MTEYALPCIVCGAQLEQVFAEHTTDNQPSNGVCFSTQGHYGSTVFDPMDGTNIEINVCDTCLEHAAEKNHIYATRITRHVWLRNPYDADGRIPYTIVGYEVLSRPRVPWRPNFDGYLKTDCLQFETVAELTAAMEENHNIVVNLEMLKDIA